MTEEPEVPSWVKREVARLQRKVDSQAEQLKEKDKTIKARPERAAQEIPGRRGQQHQGWDL